MIPMNKADQLLQKLKARHRLDWDVRESNVEVKLGDSERHQTVYVTKERDTFVFTSVVLGQAAVTRSNKRWRDLALISWQRNAGHELVTFAFDKHDRLVGQIRHPAEYLDAEELETYLTVLARECDHFEYLLKGSDLF